MQKQISKFLGPAEFSLIFFALIFFKISRGDKRSALNSAEEIVKKIVKLAKFTRSDKHNALSSTFVARNEQFRRKACDVNYTLNRLCRAATLHYIDHDRTITKLHLNGSKFHFNKSGAQVLLNSFTEAISYIIY